MTRPAFEPATSRTRSGRSTTRLSRRLSEHDVVDNAVGDDNDNDKDSEIGDSAEKVIGVLQRLQL